MWVYDGEEWTDEGSSDRKPETAPRPPLDEFVPELQVIEIVQVPPVKPNYVPFPLP